MMYFPLVMLAVCLPIIFYKIHKSLSYPTNIKKIDKVPEIIIFNGQLHETWDYPLHVDDDVDEYNTGSGIAADTYNASICSWIYHYIMRGTGC